MKSGSKKEKFLTKKNLTGIDDKSNLFNEKWITPKDIEEHLQLSHGTVNKLIHSGAFTTIQVGKSIRIKEADYIKFLETYMNNKYNM